ncbi:M15 family metallopeptidase [Rickettsiales endosymbiont of Stachyamoeba lipophora]|uniref:M15 family metallopeptidase n=1 Tax=Rickettsiales endosymbiont of Stachyamoeba lipophora TaxID=2486578 RepID=UPI000F64E35A|nr:M15 family metallopeptidase [Rickettsiales endosymbiont of Stachyamoeba lipophora]AZL16050.1 peptidase M15 [Rickettsiales endosymbiont of Stachyamoeba lipophora]
MFVQFGALAIGLLVIAVLADNPMHEGFVYLNEVDPTIIQSVKYCKEENFVGRPIKGYEACEIIITKKTAERLKYVQSKVNQLGYGLVVYDGYRPIRAVNDFIDWSQDLVNQQNKNLYYPRIDKSKAVEFGYLSSKSSHIRGSSVDVTLIKIGGNIKPIVIEARYLNDGYKIPYLDDGTVDMGTSFNFFDVASYQFSPLIESYQQNNRDLLKYEMEEAGFRGYNKKWWHFTLEDEPHKERYFDFIIKPKR